MFHQDLRKPLVNNISWAKAALTLADLLEDFHGITVKEQGLTVVAKAALIHADHKERLTQFYGQSFRFRWNRSKIFAKPLTPFFAAGYLHPSIFFCEERLKPMSDRHSDDIDEDGFIIRLRDNTMYDEVISGLQKMVRRGLEREALVLALGLFDSGYGKALAKRLPVIAAEDVGLAAPDVVAQVCILSSTWISLKRESAKSQPDGLPLMMAVMLMCRAPKNREVDDACVVIREKAKRGTGDKPGDVIQAWETLIVDSHTRRGKERLTKIAEECGLPYEQVAWEDFYKNGAVLSPLKFVEGNKWAHQAYELFGLHYDDVVEGAGGS